MQFHVYAVHETKYGQHCECEIKLSISSMKNKNNEGKLSI